MVHIDACLLQCAGIEERCQALLLKGTIAQTIGRYSEAKACFEEVAQAFPGPRPYAALSGALIACREFERAAVAARAGLALSTEQDSPVVLELTKILGDALLFDHNYEEAAIAYRQVISLMPQHGIANHQLGYILEFQDDLDAAIEHYEQAVKFNPELVGSRSNLAFVLLAAGRFKEAWPHFEHRWAGMLLPGRQMASPPALPIRRWKGSFSDCNDQHLLVLAEQGFGDTLQFCRYLPMVLEQFAEVGFVCPKPLQKLIVHSLGTRHSNLVLLDDVPQDFWNWDQYIPLMSMPVVFETDLQTIPATMSYLSAEPYAAQSFASRLNKLESSSLPRIGIAWAGGHAGLGVDQWRSISPKHLGPLINWPHACWVSLQKPETEEKRLGPDQRAKVIDWMDEMNAFADTAALISGLDLVISVDTSVAHLAAAMGKPVWLLNRFGGCWRWLRNRDDSPWYPTMRIFTQKERGNWNEVFGRVLKELHCHDFRKGSDY
ncbi:TPR repeat-containing protein [Caballeronia temeraria]|uniref:TPR repeat-containing protein n=2 Tax=Caballeronia temeraria TaxID=1777137 RepID=A0A158AC08_9BURK|nr:TPR repeat-containing protein [Caballeronia temeraria]